MASISERIKTIKEQKVGSSSRRVLLVEGPDDVNAFEQFLHKTNYDWSREWVIAEAGKKTDVLAIIQKESDWIGVIDRDEWSLARLLQLEITHPNLWILPRYCIENYLIVPGELWSAVPAKRQAALDGGLDTLSQQLLADLERWIAHAALWQEVNPMWEGLRQLGFKEALLDPAIATDDEAIREKLEQWHDYLNPANVFEGFEQKREALGGLPLLEQLTLNIHGKKFFEQVVNPVLNQLLGQMKSVERQRAIFRHLPASEEFMPLWQKMELT